MDYTFVDFIAQHAMGMLSVAWLCIFAAVMVVIAKEKDTM